MEEKIKNKDVLSSGQVLKNQLGLKDYKYVYISRSTNSTPTIYHIIVDTHFSDNPISYSKLKKIHTSQLLYVRGGKVVPLNFNLPWDLDKYNDKINRNSVINIIDLAGEKRTALNYFS